jgi:hypothetical protein
MSKRFGSHVYLPCKYKFVKRELVVIRDPDGYLFAHREYPTKILPTDLPEWYIHGYIYKQHGYISAKGVKQLVYKPNYVFDNHLHKDDFLYIAYSDEKPIEPYQTDHGTTLYRNYDELVHGHMIVEFLDAAEKYSGYDVAEIRAEVVKKKAWFLGRNKDKGVHGV